jgi:hypothetical protein
MVGRKQGYWLIPGALYSPKAYWRPVLNGHSVTELQTGGLGPR